MQTEAFPVGGPRRAVHNEMRRHGFTMHPRSDKVWARADGVRATIYGAGSMLLITGGDVTIDLPVADALAKLAESTNHA